LVFATQVKRKSLRTRTVFILNQSETACMLGFRMPFYSYRSASGLVAAFESKDENSLETVERH
jgi:hypothetical protein